MFFWFEKMNVDGKLRGEQRICIEVILSCL